MTRSISRGFAVLITAVLLLMAPGWAWSDHPMVDIRVLLEETGATLEWDEFGRTGILLSGLDSIGFSPGNGTAVADFRDLLHIEPIAYDHGQLLLPESTHDFLLDRLGQTAEALRVRPIKAIVIDAGHGGKDPGTNRTISVNGESVTILEKDIVLDMAKRVQESLSGLVDGPLVVLSRDTDVFLELGERTTFANSLRRNPLDNILFVSLHVNAAVANWSDARGVEVYYLPPTHRRQVLEEEIALTLDPEVAAILNDLKEEEYTLESVLMGQYVMDAISVHMPQTPIERGIRVADFFVVREARMPSILIETGFINNRQDLDLLRTPEYRQELAQSISKGIAAYVRDFEQLH
ncbi:MAG: N-acetylmuramoyl-L-alanine amidase [Spirochaetales bacterium]|nr:MAG: N-acetylmuramoyl-L-alanine amidase [Spirochaetales bacterium]